MCPEKNFTITYNRHTFQVPTTKEEWMDIAKDFETLHGFYNCLGALDGKHIKIQHPPNSGSLYYNYKGYYSIVLMALVNAKKEFIMIDVGCNGRVSDGGVLYYTKFWDSYQTGKLNLPEAAPLPNTTETFPFVFTADEAFALGPNLMKPYALKNATKEELTFNYRLSKARGVVECAFGILAAKFGIFQKAIWLTPAKAAKVTTACCYLHNYLLKTEPHFYLSSSGDSQNINVLEGMQRTIYRNTLNSAKILRDRFCNYYNAN